MIGGIFHFIYGMSSQLPNFYFFRGVGGLKPPTSEKHTDKGIVRRKHRLAVKSPW
jgi:hypothetical protein